MVKERKLYLDLLRIIAIIFVIYNHTSEKGYYLYAFDCSMPFKIIYMSTGALIAVAVPIFFMISGSLLIPKEESLKDLYLKRVLRMVIVLAVFSVIQYAFNVIVNKEELSIQFFFKNILTDNIIPAYWYLYAYIAYLICLPFLRKLAKNMSNAEFKYLFILFVIIEGVFSLVLYVLYQGGYNSFFVIPFFNRIVIYPLLGYYMEHRVEESRYNVKGMLKWILLMIIVIALIVAMSIYRNLPYEEFTIYDKGLFTTGFTIILDVGVFYIAKMIFKQRKANKGVSFILTALGSTVFGVYLTENIIRNYTVGVYDYLASVVGRFIAAWIWCTLVFLIGAVIIYIIKLIPGVKKIL
ncbi:MAG: acyltransferase [Lachnospiraceae bacterium]|nr:acyltransferase [Lachnospiraceae bacterium]